ncbi:phasin family protein [Dyella ginsengisoli]|uniref:phasin family protein n=1 Tax=Dyella ginsengisoli TaxID=363848 RepID=UPI00034777EC|nr:phasin family protein [Dyella ginsengisoli]
MNQQFTSQAFSYAKQFSDNAFKAHTLALKGFETVAGLQFKNFEKQAKVSADFFAEAMEVRDADGFRSLWEKGAGLSRDAAERAVAAGQEIFAVTQKTVESLGAILQEQQAAANEAVSAPVQAVKKAAGK